VTPALAGLRVVEMAGDIAGPYCAKLLADLGAEVTKIERPSGDPMREWGPFPGGVPDPNRSGLFEYLNAGKYGTTVDLEADASAASRLIADAHVLVEALGPGMLDRLGLGVRVLEALRPGLVVVRISDFGHRGPLRDRVAPADRAGGVGLDQDHRDPDRPPVQAGARISEYVAGGYGAFGALTALRTLSSNTTHLVEVDVSVLESLPSTLPYPMLMAEKMRSLGMPATTRSAPMMGIVRAADGWIGINCLTGQHWLDACAMLGLPEYGEHQVAIMLGGPRRAEFYEKAQPWLAERTVAEIVGWARRCGFRFPRSTTGLRSWTARNTGIASSSWARLVTTGRSAGRAPRSGCRGRPCCRRAPRLASVRKQPPKRLRDHLIGAPVARARSRRSPSQASRFLT
jgi:crotonobetainyl-CoA:carnitine CoA-transferase CaiB-like acyl-CoA transferase